MRVGQYITARMVCLSRRQCLNILLAVVLVEMVVILVSEIGLHLPHWVIVKHNQSSNYVEGIDSVTFNNEESSESFLSRHEEYCEKNLLPKPSNILRFLDQFGMYNDTNLCPCVPETLGEFYFV